MFKQPVTSGNNSPETHPAELPDSEHSHATPLQTPYKPYSKEPSALSEPPYKPYADKPATNELPYEPYKDI